MYITQETDYALRMVYCLAKADTRRDSRSIGKDTGVTLRFALKILGKLSAAGVVSSHKGHRGGDVLARPAAEITLKDVMSAVEGPYVFSRCLEGACACDYDAQDNCAFQHTFGRITHRVNTELAAVSFQDLLDENAGKKAEN